MKTALVTGANRGIGLELTMQLLDSGYNVHATYRSNKGGLDEINNSALSIHQMDVRNKEDISVVIQSINSLDLLINNAGIADGRWQSISEITSFALSILPGHRHSSVIEI